MYLDYADDLALQCEDLRIMLLANAAVTAPHLDSHLVADHADRQAEGHCTRGSETANVLGRRLFRELLSGLACLALTEPELLVDAPLPCRLLATACVRQSQGLLARYGAELQEAVLHLHRTDAHGEKALVAGRWQAAALQPRQHATDARGFAGRPTRTGQLVHGAGLHDGGAQGAGPVTEVPPGSGLGSLRALKETLEEGALLDLH
mmetsp:Transcript_43074/g.136948  ORF Transcript_43074/g.136948 Transcript_43074/m.136948 type:complete len:206 (-) Transcript_43074:325-942(-)